jgi:hypothetical protein
VLNPARIGKDKKSTTLSLNSGKGFFIGKNMNSKEINQPPMVGFVPKRLEIEGRPDLNPFPLNMLFAAFKNERGKKIAYSALYQPDLATFKKEKGILSMKYDNFYGESWVIIEYVDSVRSYIGTKYVDGQAVRNAVGVDFIMFFAHFTAQGLADNEPCMYEVVNTELQGRPSD